MKDNTLCLVMIVKNEGPRLPRCFAYIKQFLDYYIIVDTGSSDDTRLVIKEELIGIPGEIHKMDWVNFGHNRTESLKLAKGKADYLILSDADEQIILDNFNKNSLTHDRYMVKYNGKMSYRVPYLIKGDLDWEYVGVTHEYLSGPDNNSIKNIETISINDFGDGGSKSNKYTRDRELLESGLENEPGNVRYMFYLANTYRALGMYGKAIHWYNKRILSGGWDEEISCSYLYKGRCEQLLNPDSNNSLTTFLDGYNFNVKRFECLYEAIKIYRLDKKYNLAFMLIREFKSIQFPENDILFIERDIYDWKLDYEISIVYYYVTNKSKGSVIDIGQVFKRLLSNKDVDYNSVIPNLKFYDTSIKHIESKCIDIGSLSRDINGYYNSTPALLKTSEGYLCNLRKVNYQYINGEFKGDTNVNTINVYMRLDESFELISESPFNTDDIDKIAVNGLEDVRLFTREGVTTFTANKWIDYGNIKIVTGDYNVLEKKLDYKILHSPENRGVEKNWTPITREEEDLYLYDWNPIKFIKYTGEDYKTLNKHLPGFRGSSPGITVGDEIWVLTHCVEYSNPRHYYHSIVKLDYNTLEYKDHSRLFKFDNSSIEFSVSMIYVKNKILIGYSEWDGTSKVGIYNKSILEQEIFK